MLIDTTEHPTAEAHFGEEGAEVNTQEAPEESSDANDHKCNSIFIIQLPISVINESTFESCRIMRRC